MRRAWKIAAVAAVLLAVGVAECIHKSARVSRIGERPATALDPTEPARAIETPAAVTVEPDHAAPTRSAVESAVEVGGAAERSLILEVVTSEGAAIPEARVVLAHAERVIAIGATADDGRAAFPPSGRDVDVFVLTGTAMRLRQHLDEAVGLHVLKLPAGIALRGIVLVDNQPPSERMRLALHSRDERVGLEPPPPFVQRQIDFRGYEGRPFLSVVTDAAGHFRFDDLPPTWSGTLSAPYDYTWEVGDEPLEIADPRAELVVRLRRPPAITGRVVAPGTSTGVANASGSYDFECSDGSASGEVEADAQGRFRIRIECGHVTRLTATLARAGIGRCSIELHDVPATGLDLGDVALVPTREVYFVVHDAQGRPIEGAIARTLDAPPIESGPTDASGKGILSAMPLTLDLIRVLALEHRSVARGVDATSATESAPLDVTLERLPVLDIAIRQRDGSPAPEVFARVLCWDTHPFVSEEGDGSNPIQIDLGAPSPGERRSQSFSNTEKPSYDLRYRTGELGRIRIPGLLPTVRIGVRVEDVTGQTLAEKNVDPALLRSGEPCVLVIDEPPRALELHVVDAEGRPIVGAQILSSADRSILATTLADGLATVEPIFARSIDLRVWASGFALAIVDGVQLDARLERREVALTGGLSVRVRAVDGAGHTVPADGVDARIGSQVFGKISRCPDEDCFRIDELPPSLVELSVFVGGLRFAKTHDAREPSAVIEVPEYGSVRIEFSQPLVLPARLVVMLAPAPGPHGEPPAGAEIMRMIASESPVDSLDLPVVFAGRYTVQVRELNPADKADPWLSREEGLIVRGGERTVVHSLLHHSR